MSVDEYKRTTDPIVTGSSVLGIKYKDGALVMADTLGNYGFLSRFKSLERIRKVNDSTILAAGGEYSDFQYILKLLEELTVRDFAEDDGAVLSSKEIHSYLSRVLYNRRTRVNPLYNHLITAGFEEKTPHLGMVDLYGSTYEDNYVASGYGAHMALPLMRKFWRADLSEAEAKKILEDCMTVLVYRDCRTINKFQLAKVDKTGVSISKPYSLQEQWDFKRFVNVDDQS